MDTKCGYVDKNVDINVDMVYMEYMEYINVDIGMWIIIMNVDREFL